MPSNSWHGNTFSEQLKIALLLKRIQTLKAIKCLKVMPNLTILLGLQVLAHHENYRLGSYGPTHVQGKED
jgi:hypothetical protein